MTMTCEPALAFEAETCPRCHGTGKYSYNSIDGDRCYGCSGKGRRLTKRGKAAAAYLNNLRSARLGDIQTGDVMLIKTMSRSYFAPVVNVTPEAPAQSKNHATGEWREIAMINVTTEHPTHGRSGLIGPADTIVRKGFSAEDKMAQMQAALAYQATLTKTGQPKKK